MESKFTREVADRRKHGKSPEEHPRGVLGRIVGIPGATVNDLSTDREDDLSTDREDDLSTDREDDLSTDPKAKVRLRGDDNVKEMISYVLTEMANIRGTCEGNPNDETSPRITGDLGKDLETLALLAQKYDIRGSEVSAYQKAIWEKYPEEKGIAGRTMKVIGDVQIEKHIRYEQRQAAAFRNIMMEKTEEKG